MNLGNLLALLGGLLLLSAFFSGSETALFSLNRIQIRRLHGSRRRRDRAVARLLDRPSDLLAAILVGNTLVNVAFSALMTTFFFHLPNSQPEKAALYASLTSFVLVILWGEITPKTIAIRSPEMMSRLVARPLGLVILLLRPSVALLSWVAHLFLRVIGIHDLPGARGSLTPAELRVLFEEVEEDAVLSHAERQIASRIFEFSSTRAAEVMTPRVDIRSADRRVSAEALAEVVRISRHTRIPISDGSIDRILGFINSKEYLLNPGASLDQLLKPVLVVPETKRVNEIFHEIQRRRIGMVVVVDEYGHTVGIITKEDLVEEIVGEIYDEYEADQQPIVKIGPDRFLVTGQVAIDELSERFGVLFETEAVTLNGLLSDLRGGIPRPGDRVVDHGLQFQVLEVRRHRVHRCEIRRLPAAQAEDEEREEAPRDRGGDPPGSAAYEDGSGDESGGDRR